MTRFAICSALYEAGRPFLADWMAGIRAAAEGRVCRVIVAVDDLADAGDALGPLNDVATVTAVQAPTGATPAAVRRVMLDAAAASDADLLVFCDMDDWLLEDALAQHENALSDADFSYGDLLIVDSGGASGSTSFFAGASVPRQTTAPEDILDRNWLGFSNTAVRSSALPAEALRVPDDIVAADWWFFSALLDAGLRGQCTASPVALYRRHDDNVLGPEPADSSDSVLRRCDIMRRHYAARPQSAAMTGRAAAIDNLCDVIAADPSRLHRMSAEARARPGLWYEDVSRLVAALRNGKHEIDHDST